jgi:hypothetical protein
MAAFFTFEYRCWERFGRSSDWSSAGERQRDTVPFSIVIPGRGGGPQPSEPTPATENDEQKRPKPVLDRIPSNLTLHRTPHFGDSLHEAFHELRV